MPVVATQTESVHVHAPALCEVGTQTAALAEAVPQDSPETDGEWELVDDCAHANLTTSGSNQYMRRRRCKDCGRVWKAPPRRPHNA